MKPEKDLHDVKPIFRMCIYKGKFRDKDITFAKEYHEIRKRMREIPQIRILKFGNSLEDEMPKGLAKKIAKVIDDFDDLE